MSGDFESILDRSLDEVTEPKLYPTGTWRVRCVGVSAKKSEDGADQFQLAFIGVAPEQDVDEDELAAIPEGALDGQKIWVRRTIESNADAYNFKRMLEAFGVDTKGLSGKEAVQSMKGREALGYVGLRTYTDSQGEAREDNTLKQFVPLD